MLLTGCVVVKFRRQQKMIVYVSRQPRFFRLMALYTLRDDREMMTSEKIINEKIVEFAPSLQGNQTVFGQKQSRTFLRLEEICGQTRSATQWGVIIMVQSSILYYINLLSVNFFIPRLNFPLYFIKILFYRGRPTVVSSQRVIGRFCPQILSGR